MNSSRDHSSGGVFLPLSKFAGVESACVPTGTQWKVLMAVQCYPIGRLRTAFSTIEYQRLKETDGEWRRLTGLDDERATCLGCRRPTRRRAFHSGSPRTRPRKRVIQSLHSFFLPAIIPIIQLIQSIEPTENRGSPSLLFLIPLCSTFSSRRNLFFFFALNIK
jgi:hypothetical protein